MGVEWLGEEGRTIRVLRAAAMQGTTARTCAIFVYIKKHLSTHRARSCCSSNAMREANSKQTARSRNIKLSRAHWEKKRTFGKEDNHGGVGV